MSKSLLKLVFRGSSFVGLTPINIGISSSDLLVVAWARDGGVVTVNDGRVGVKLSKCLTGALGLSGVLNTLPIISSKKLLSKSASQCGFKIGEGAKMGFVIWELGSFRQLDELDKNDLVGVTFSLFSKLFQF